MKHLRNRWIELFFVVVVVFFREKKESNAQTPKHWWTNSCLATQKCLPNLNDSCIYREEKRYRKYNGNRERESGFPLLTDLLEYHTLSFGMYNLSKEEIVWETPVAFVTLPFAMYSWRWEGRCDATYKLFIHVDDWFLSLPVLKREKEEKIWEKCKSSAWPL